MNGLQYLRKCLNMTAEEFAELIGVSRPSISKWERGIEPISRKQSKRLMDIFHCEAAILQQEIDSEQMMKLNSIVTMYQLRKETEETQKKLEKLHEKLIDSQENMRIRSVTEALERDEDLLFAVEKLIRLFYESKGRDSIKFTLTLAELYMSGEESNLAVGKSDYCRGLIGKDDSLVKMMLYAMNLALKK